MTNYYEHIYTALRSAMIDRDMGDKPEDAILVNFVSAQVALKKEIPSAALLIAYSMLYYPNWINDSDPIIGTPPVSKTVETFIGGVENPPYPLLFNIHMGMIAVAVGCYANLWTIKYSTILETILIQPNMSHPLVLKTRELIIENKLNYTHARDVFIELMQQEEYKQDIILADDYVANATFIPEDEVNVEETDSNERIRGAIPVDLSKEFGTMQGGNN